MKAIDSTITVSKIENRYKNVVRPTDFNLNLEDFPQLPCIAPVRISVSFIKFIIKVVSNGSVCIGKPFCDSNVSPNKPVSASFVRTSNRNARPNKTVSATSVSPIFGSSARASKPIRAINILVKKPISEHVSVWEVLPSESSSSSHARSSNIVSVSNIHPSKTVSASNFCPGKPVCTNSGA